MRILLVMGLFLQLTTYAYAEPLICFKNKSEYDDVKSKLPKILQEEPLLFAAENAKVMMWSVSVVASLQFVNETTRFFLNASTGMTKPFESPGRNFCANSKELKITLPNGESETLKIISETEVVAKHDVKLVKVKPSTYNRVAQAIGSKTDVASSIQRSGQGGNAQ